VEETIVTDNDTMVADDNLVVGQHMDVALYNCDDQQ